VSRPDTADDLAPVLTHLQARVDALDAWRAHQSDLLDEHLNNHPDPDDLDPADDLDGSEIDDTAIGGADLNGHGLDKRPATPRSAATHSSSGCTTPLPPSPHAHCAASSPGARCGGNTPKPCSGSKPSTAPGPNSPPNPVPPYRSGSATTSTPAYRSCSAPTGPSPTAPTPNATATAPTPTGRYRPCPPPARMDRPHNPPGSAAVAVLAAPLLLVGLLLTITTTTMNPAAAPAAINVDALPPLARELYPTCKTCSPATVRNCLAWRWPSHRSSPAGTPPPTTRRGHAAGLYLLTQPAWTAAGGTPWPTTPPPPDAPVFQPEPHLQRAIPFICATSTPSPTQPGRDRETHEPTRRAAGLPRRRLRPASSTPPPASRPRRGWPARDACARPCTATSPPCTPSSTHITQPEGPGWDRRHAQPRALYRSCRGRMHGARPQQHGLASPRHAPRPRPNPRRVRAPPAPTRRSVRSLLGPPHLEPHQRPPPRSRLRPVPHPCRDLPTGTDLANGWQIATWLRAHATALHISYLIWQDATGHPPHPTPPETGESPTTAAASTTSTTPPGVTTTTSTPASQ
jgi:hypothetical protein